MKNLTLIDNAGEALSLICVADRAICGGRITELDQETYNGLCALINNVRNLLKEGLAAVDKTDAVKAA